MRDYNCPEEAQAVYEAAMAEGDRQSWEASESARGEYEAEAQAEKTGDIAYKAGMRTVVEWIKNHGGSLDGFRAEWQASLEEWGIE